MARLSLHGHVTGRVQGVGFRHSTATEAVRQGLSGWVRNLGDGLVELFFEGTAAAVGALASWLESGPPQAEVTELELQEQPWQGHTGFVVQR
ncbi:acylphosphatase [Pseudomonas flavescens]|uniref:Acylphosphatase n=1 Tax=Phytopseudomonas flavescens TaxID=29435 RepID=A0A1G8JDJ1_9GAMM|nr:acylphosphatase [Pseudomonas flavescens]SDI28720.1 acylphosphatase [Pseudomonas flavescens]